MKGALVFVQLDEDQCGHMDKVALRQVAEQIEKIEPDAYYFPMTKSMSVSILDLDAFKNKDVLVTIRHDPNVSEQTIKEQIESVLQKAKSVQFVFADFKIEV